MIGGCCAGGAKVWHFCDFVVGVSLIAVQKYEGRSLREVAMRARISATRSFDGGGVFQAVELSKSEFVRWDVMTRIAGFGQMYST